MSLLSRARILVASAAIVSAVAVPFASAQEISETHLKAARAAIAAINATGTYDAILPTVAASLKDQLIQQSPNMQELIEKTVDEKTIALAARRADLEKEAATAYAKVFSEADLTAIATFYASDAGKKLLSDGPIVTREVVKAADIWQRGIARDLAVQVAEVLGKAAGATPAPAADGTTPAPAPVTPAPAQ
jgi:hypothetical protein